MIMFQPSFYTNFLINLPLPWSQHCSHFSQLLMSLARNSNFFPFSTINYRHDRPTKISQKIARSHKITLMFRPKRFTLKSYKRLYFVCKNLNLLAYKVYLIVWVLIIHHGISNHGNLSSSSWSKWQSVWWFWIAERWSSKEWWRPCILSPSQGLWGD